MIINQIVGTVGLLWLALLESEDVIRIYRAGQRIRAVVYFIASVYTFGLIMRFIWT
jgi:hypothetical protein